MFIIIFIFIIFVIIIIILINCFIYKQILLIPTFLIFYSNIIINIILTIHILMKSAKYILIHPLFFIASLIFRMSRQYMTNQIIIRFKYNKFVFLTFDFLAYMMRYF